MQIRWKHWNRQNSRDG